MSEVIKTNDTDAFGGYFGAITDEIVINAFKVKNGESPD